MTSLVTLVAYLASRVERSSIWGGTISRNMALGLSAELGFDFKDGELPASRMRSISWPEPGNRVRNGSVHHIYSR